MKPSKKKDVFTKFLDKNDKKSRKREKREKEIEKDECLKHGKEKNKYQRTMKDDDFDIFDDMKSKMSKKKYVFEENDDQMSKIPIISEIFDDTDEIDLTQTYTIAPGIEAPKPIMVEKISGKDYGKIKFKDLRFETQQRLCEDSKRHDDEAKIICKNIIDFIAVPQNCVRFVADWFRSRIFPDVSERNEILFLMVHIIFSPVLFSLTASDGYNFFDSFERINDLLQVQKYMNKVYNIVKERFAMRTAMINDHEKCNDCIHLLQHLKCLDEPKVEASGYGCKMANFAHNDYLHAYSGVFRSNLILSIIYYKLRLNMGNEKTFKNYQLMFLNILTFTNYLLYTHGKLCCVQKENIEMVGCLITEINRRDMYINMNNDLYLFYKQQELEQKRRILEYCAEKYPELSTSEVALLI